MFKESKRIVKLRFCGIPQKSCKVGKMKLIKKGNVYKRQSWLKEHEYEILITLCIIVGFFCFVLAMIIRG